MTDTQKIIAEMKARGSGFCPITVLNDWADRLAALEQPCEPVAPRFVGNMTDTHHLRFLLEQAQRENAKFIPLHPIELRELLDAVANPAPAVVTDAMVLVPREPTEAMVEAACISNCERGEQQWLDDSSGGVKDILRNIHRKAYAAMIAAAQGEG